MKLRARKLFLVLVAMNFLAGVGLSQEGRGIGRLFGTVVDESGNPVEAVKVTIVSLSFAFQSATATDKKGSWAFAGLGTGAFEITATKEGFRATNLKVNVSQFKNPPQKIVLKKPVEAAELSREGIADRSLFEEANSLYDRGNYGAALALFQDFLDKNPVLYMVRLNIGNCYRGMKEYDKALAEYNLILEKIREKDPELKSDVDAAKVFAAIGELYFEQNDLVKVQEFLKKAVELFPRDKALVYNVAEIYFQAGQVDQAIEYYLHAAVIDPTWPNAFLKLGYAYLNKGHIEESVKNFRKFLELAPDDPQSESVRKLIEQLKK